MRNHTLKIKIPYSLHKEGISMKKAIFPILLCICALLCSCGSPSISTTSGRTTDAGMTTQSDTVSGTPTGTTGTMQTTDSATGTASATTSDTAVSTTLRPVYARLDFGTKSRAADNHLTSHESIIERLTYDKEAISVEFTEDSMIITANKDGTFKAAGEKAALSDSQWFIRDSDTCYYPVNTFAIMFDDLPDYDFEGELVSGYGTWSGYPHSYDNVGVDGKWGGGHQYMKIRIKNPGDNNKIAMAFNNASAYASTQFCVMGIREHQPEYRTYIYDITYAATYPSGKGVMLPGIAPGNNWTWKQNYEVTGLRFHLLGSTCSYANAYLNNKFEENESAADYDAFKEYFSRLDSRALIKKDDRVEIDYIIFGGTPEQLNSYKSYIEASEATSAK